VERVIHLYLSDTVIKEGVRVRAQSGARVGRQHPRFVVVAFSGAADGLWTRVRLGENDARTLARALLATLGDTAWEAPE